ncbi:hypothetical protein [Mesobacillus foraminis]|uniref:Replication initiator protein n=1 Tax=Mesobacillus foraminis TaxID=279826 RepID=A0A4R2BHU5_9BACI|nr:hypothetical protein [Mesobacillus foraminis]TCN25504.1 hypothetical protein EV146_105161 [Mesobacillus foraminis]
MATETESKKKLHVQVPTYIVRNDGIFLSNSEFVIYVRLCFLHFRNAKEDKAVLEIDHRELMRLCQISDTRTLRKRLKQLHKLDLIKNEIEKLPTKGRLKIIFNPDKLESDHFTMMSTSIFTYLANGQIDEYAFRQVFYYKSHINTKEDKKFCFVGYDTLVERLKISKTNIKAANDKLKKAKLVKITVHKLEWSGGYTDANELYYEKFNNHYTVDNSLF